MKRFLLLIFIFSCVAMCAVAGVRPVDHGELKNSLMNRNYVNKAPHHLSAEDMTGCRIAVMQARNFLDDGTLDSVSYHLGWESYLSPWNLDYGTLNGSVYSLTNNQNDYELPIEIDLEARRAYLYSYEVGYTEVSKKVGRVLYDTIRTVYVLPEAFMDEDAEDYPSVITGHIYDDGSIAFDDGFIYYTEVVYRQRHYADHSVLYADTTWSVSPVYQNLLLLVPNGLHQFSSVLQNIHVTEGSSFQVSELIADMISLKIDWGLVGTLGLGGSVGTPINPRPIKPGTLWEGVRACLSNGSGVKVMPPQSYQYTVPVYMYQPNDSTLCVYNLYGEGLTENYLELHFDGSMTMPGQQIAYSVDKGAAVFNCSKDTDNETLLLGNQGIVTSDTITWGLTLPFTENGLLFYNYNGNKLTFTDGSNFVLPAKLGDVNRDGMVSIADVTTLLDYLLNDGSDGLGSFSFDAADVNQDGHLSIGDATDLVDLLLTI
jgi:hypothetical protein